MADLKIVKIKFDKSPKANENCCSVYYGCIRLIGSYQFLSDILDK